MAGAASKVAIAAFLVASVTAMDIDPAELAKAFQNLDPELLAQMGTAETMVKQMPDSERKGALADLEDNMGMNKVCGTPVRCEAGQEPVPKALKFRASEEACFPFRGMYDLMAKMAGDDEDDGALDPLGTCCRQLLACYRSCGRPEKACRREFVKCGETTCFMGNGDREECANGLSYVVDGIRMNKCDTYARFQKASCQCVASGAEADNARAELLRTFYSVHNPENLFKVPKLLEKVDTPLKFAALSAKLATKYPESIVDIDKDDLIDDMGEPSCEEKFA